MNTDLLEPPIIRSYRKRMSHHLTTMAQESRAFLSSVEELHARGGLSNSDVLSAWNEFIAAQASSPTSVIFAAPTGRERDLLQVLLEVLDAQLSQAAAQRGLAIAFQYTITPLEQGQPS